MAESGVSDKVYIAGHTGLVGSALLRCIPHAITRSRAELDLTDQRAVDYFFHHEKPEHVYLAAAKVGGIHANRTYPAEFIRDNLAIQTNVIHSAWRHGVKKLLFLGSSCIYPRDAQQPMTESCLLSGPLEPTNQWYAIAKIAGLKMCEAYRRQYGFNCISVMPTNLYGPGDHFNSEDAHVVPSLISRFQSAVDEGRGRVTLWGSGKAKRELLHVDDLVDALLLLMDRYEGDLINIGSGQEVAIRELAEMIAEITGFKGEIEFDESKPDGPMRKLVDSSKIKAMWSPKISLYDGLLSTVEWYRSQLVAA